MKKLFDNDKKTKKIIMRNIIPLIMIVLFISRIIYCYMIIYPAFEINNPVSIYINESKNYNDLLLQLQFKAHIKNIYYFKQLALITKYIKSIKAGKYEITPQTTYLQAMQMFWNGRQKPVKLIFNNIRLKEDFASQIGNQLMLDSKALLDYLNNPSIVNSLGFDTVTIPAMFIPNTYEIYWNIPIDEFLRKMKKEYNQFWTTERLIKAKSMLLSPIEVSILASIVEEETNFKSEYPIIAGLYLNRLRKGMLLQADPTIKFAVKDFTLKRIFLKYLKTNSPYNTYKNHGLPPGPIRIPSISAIDGVLNYQNHTYLYMCAKEDLSGKHSFVTTLNEHSQNARKYHIKLNKLNI